MPGLQDFNFDNERWHRANAEKAILVSCILLGKPARSHMLLFYCLGRPISSALEFPTAASKYPLGLLELGRYHHTPFDTAHINHDSSWEMGVRRT